MLPFLKENAPRSDGWSLESGMFRTRPNSSLAQLKYPVLVAILILFIYSYLLPPTIWEGQFRISTAQDRVLLPRDAASNSTLGFHKVLVLSTGPSWRTRGLQAARAFTGLDFEIIKQPHSTDELAEAFRKIGPADVTHPPLGSTLAWLAHLDMVRFIVASDFETVMILEDDVDWDISLKKQMGLLSDNVREFTNTNDSDTTPYGSSWDILWIGHCGEHTDPTTPRLEFPDASSPVHANYTGWSQKYLVNVKEGHRAVQHGINPVCTFAYAVSRTGAQKILEWAGKGQSEAYDIRLMSGCKSRELDCITVTPELMHHYTPPKELGYLSPVDEKDSDSHSTDEADFEKVMGKTENIMNSTRCRVLFNSTCLE